MKASLKTCFFILISLSLLSQSTNHKRKFKMPINLSLPVTMIKLFNPVTNEVSEVREMGKLNLKSAKEVAKREKCVLISKENVVQDFTVEPSNLTPVAKTN